jgi:16S rRNA G966 N2-methylase RsmD
MSNTLFYGDNLYVLRKHVADELVDLIYLDPPFNSKRDYNVSDTPFHHRIEFGVSKTKPAQSRLSPTPFTTAGFESAVSAQTPNSIRW